MNNGLTNCIGAIILEGNEFYDINTDKAMLKCKSKAYAPLFMPSIVDLRINADEDARLWKIWYCTPSIKVTGRTNKDSVVVVYAHIPNYFCEQENIRRAIDLGLINHAGRVPQQEFDRLVKLDGVADLQGNRLVWVVDYDKITDAPSEVISVDYALEHPQTIPFLGGVKRAEMYLKKYKEVYGKKIGVWYTEDKYEQPLGRLLFISSCIDGLLGSVLLGGGGRFLGIKSASKTIEYAIESFNVSRIISSTKEKLEFEMKNYIKLC
ncbi:hypothetical protein HYX19_04750 [Candidatus Woesearchaeota archaeon]|nr:hypothetical protein [Candidatus Woesearchaeota archaeon]MBI2673545.1 hypothetical protein [Candidatus Woesearchaeota archaeon]